MVYTIEEIKSIIEPIAKKYCLKSVYVFGSYARGDANQSSDIDLLIDRAGSTIKGMFDMGSLYNDLCNSYGKEVDLVTTHVLEQNSTKIRIPYFVANLKNERVKIYG